MTVVSRNTQVTYSTQVQDSNQNVGNVSFVMTITPGSIVTESDLDDVALGAIAVLDSKYIAGATVRTVETVTANTDWS